MFALFFLAAFALWVFGEIVETNPRLAVAIVVVVVVLAATPL